MDMGRVLHAGRACGSALVDLETGGRSRDCIKLIGAFVGSIHLRILHARAKLATTQCVRNKTLPGFFPRTTLHLHRDVVVCIAALAAGWENNQCEKSYLILPPLEGMLVLVR